MESGPASNTNSPRQTQQLRVLLQLLDDEDPRVFRAIEPQLLHFGQRLLPHLEPFLHDEKALVRRRARKLLRQVLQQQADAEFLHFCQKAPQFLNLEKALLLLSRTAYPDISIEGYLAVLDEMQMEFMDRVHGRGSALTVIPLLNEYIFRELGIQSVSATAAEEQDYYLSKLIDERAGHPALVCCFYLILARRSRLPVAAVDLAGHLICRFQTSTECLYIDPANRGRMMTQVDCMRYLNKMGLSWALPNFRPLTPKQVLQRVCELLSGFYYEHNRKTDSVRTFHYASALRGK